jgi:MFS family permease
VLYGAGDGLVGPAEVGLIPQTVSPPRLQQANALQGLSRSAVRVVGPAIGGILVVAASPGVALALDSASFFVCAFLLGLIRIPIRADVLPQRFQHELREGWREFSSRTWLWSTVLLFGIGNIFFMFWQVLGPTIAKERLGGAGPWATILTVAGVGSVVGGFWAIRHRPKRPLVACILWPLLYVPQLIALAAGAATWAVAVASFGAGLAISIHLTLWFTIFQREIPERAQSRVQSYDALGSFVLTPLGAAIAGPIAAGIGSNYALYLAAAAIVVCNTMMLLIPAVWRIRRADPPEVATTLAQ